MESYEGEIRLVRKGCLAREGLIKSPKAPNQRYCYPTHRGETAMGGMSEGLRGMGVNLCVEHKDGGDGVQRLCREMDVEAVAVAG